MLANGGIIPTNIGLDGKIGRRAGGKWYGGVYGWGFTVIVPQTGKLAHRNTHHLGLAGFMNAYLLTGDDRYLDAWRKQIDEVNAQQEDRSTARRCTRTCTATRAGTTSRRRRISTAPWRSTYLSMKAGRSQAHRRQTAGSTISTARTPRYPEQALRSDLERIRKRVRRHAQGHDDAGHAAGRRSDAVQPGQRRCR